MTMGQAIEALQAGQRVSRAGWNGKGMWLFYVAEWACAETNYPKLPFLAMKTADEKVVPWLASQTDLLATDWGIVA